MSGGPDDGADVPVDPLTELAEAAVSLHCLFENYVHAGFSEEQSMRFCIAVLTSHS